MEITPCFPDKNSLLHYNSLPHQEDLGSGVIHMGFIKSLMSGPGITRWHCPVPVLILIGLLLGLGYIILLPFIGIAAFILAASQRIMRSLVIMQHRSTSVTINAQYLGSRRRQG